MYRLIQLSISFIEHLNTFAFPKNQTGGPQMRILECKTTQMNVA